MSLPTVAYLANRFPEATESYVMQEISELRRRGVKVIAFSAQAPSSTADSDLTRWSAETIRFQPLRLWIAIQAFSLFLSRLAVLGPLFIRILFRGREPFYQRLKAIGHTLLGAYFAILLKRRNVAHIHVHHGYFACWVAMVAARLLGITYSVTLHGSDLLLHKAYLDEKLRNCNFCATISEFNRHHIIDQFPEIDTRKISVRRIGVDTNCELVNRGRGPYLRILAVGRLHAVKNHHFLLEACARLKKGGHKISCVIAGEGEERRSLQQSIRILNLEAEVQLPGYLTQPQLDKAYSESDLVVLTSLSEGLPLVLMEAMARGTIVLAPALTGIPELVISGENGFLFEPGSLDDFIEAVEMIRAASPELIADIRSTARRTVVERFNRETNLADFADFFIQRCGKAALDGPHENLVLQQI